MINKLIPIIRHTIVKVFLINLFPFKLDRCAPKNPPIKEPSINKIIILKEKSLLLLKNIAPTAFQKIPTVKKVKLTALRKSIPKVVINNIVTNKPVPDDIEPFIIAIKKIKIENLNLKNKLIDCCDDDKPKSGLKKEYKERKIEKIPNAIWRYTSDINSTKDDPIITPGKPNIKICQMI